MIRMIVVFFACLFSASSQETPASPSGLQVSVGTEQLSLGIDGVPRDLTVIAVTISNPGDSPQLLIVGANYNNADHWNVTANVMNRDGKIVALSHLPRMITIAGYEGPLVIEVPAHGSSRTLLDARDFEEETGHGGTTNLSGFIHAPGEQLQIVLHCGVHPVPGNSPAANSWKGDLVSGWLKTFAPK
jgi:hypothetical protein